MNETTTTKDDGRLAGKASLASTPSRLELVLLARRRRVMKLSRLCRTATVLPQRRRLLPHPRSASSGTQAYADYLQAQARLQALEEQQEQKKSKELYQAWQRALEAKQQGLKNNKLAGVQVVKTLVKQQQLQKKKDPHQHDTISYWKTRMEGSLQAGGRIKITRLPWCNWETNCSSRQQPLDGDPNKNDVSTTNVRRALDYYQRACAIGSAEGCFNWGNLLWTGWPAAAEEAVDDSDDGATILVRPDRTAALEAFTRAMDLGDADAMYFMGVQFIDEDEDGGKMKKGLELVEKAADQGHGGALYYLALLHLNGNNALRVPACSPKEFAARLDEAVEAGDADALFLRGHSRYMGASGYTRQYAAALEDFVAAAELGHAEAAVSAGAILHQPHPGVQQDQRRAFQLYQYAGELGCRDGWRNVVACYLSGEGSSAIKRYGKAYCRNNAKGLKRSQCEDTLLLSSYRYF